MFKGLKRYLVIVPSVLLILLLTLLIMGADSCDSSTTPSASQREETQAKARQERLIKMTSLSPDFNPLIERNNIIFRSEVTASGNIMYLYRYSETGQILYRVPVVGKVTSTSKRLTKPWMAVDVHTSSSYYDWNIVEAPDPFGTYGHSTPRIFWMDPQGNYWECDPRNIVITNAPYRFRDVVIDYKSVDDGEAQWRRQWQAKLAELAAAKGIDLKSVKMAEYQKLVQEATAAVPYIP